MSHIPVNHHLRPLYRAVVVLIAAFVLFPLLRVVVRAVSERFKANDSDLVLIIVVTFLCAAPAGHVCQFAVKTGGSQMGFALPSGERKEVANITPHADKILRV